jgi:hypothetical protein
MLNNALQEMSSKNEERPRHVLWALEPTLPRTAAQAAVEFDWLIEKKRGNQMSNITRQSIHKLYVLLGESVGKAQFSSEYKGFVDSMGLSFLVKAYNDAYKNNPVKTQGELDKAVKDLVSALNDAQNDEKEIDESLLTHMRDFCAALSNYTATYRKMVYGNRSEHPYRK